MNPKWRFDLLVISLLIVISLLMSHAKAERVAEQFYRGVDR